MICDNAADTTFIGQEDYLMAMLARVDPPTWVKLPKEIQQLIIRERRAEILSQNNKGNQANNDTKQSMPDLSILNPSQPQTSANLTEVEPDEDTNALMLASIDAYLAEQDQAQ